MARILMAERQLPTAKCLLSAIRTSHFDIAKSCGRRAVSRSHHLLRLALAAIGSAPQGPVFARADGVHGIPELSGHARIGRVLQHPPQLPALDLPPHLGAELEVVALVV